MAASPAVVHVRRVGEATGYKLARPSSWSAMRELASRLLLAGSTVAQIFDRTGDRLISMDAVGSGDVLYVSNTTQWLPPPPEERVRHNLAEERQARSHRRSGGKRTEARSPLAELLPLALRWTPVNRGEDSAARLCTGKPPYGLLGDPTQLGSGANFSRLRGLARQQEHMSLCIHTARRMQASNRASVGRPPELFPRGASCAVVGSSGSLMRSGFGAAIDAHDVVLRFNLAPAGGVWAADVGNRTTIRILTDKVVAPFMRTAATAGGSKKGGGGGTGRFSRSSEPHSTLLLYCMAQGWAPIPGTGTSMNPKRHPKETE